MFMPAEIMNQLKSAWMSDPEVKAKFDNDFGKFVQMSTRVVLADQQTDKPAPMETPPVCQAEQQEPDNIFVSIVQAWKHDPALHKEFGTLGVYASYRLNEGKAKILSRTANTGQ